MCPPARRPPFWPRWRLIAPFAVRSPPLAQAQICRSPAPKLAHTKPRRASLIPICRLRPTLSERCQCDLCLRLIGPFHLHRRPPVSLRRRASNKLAPAADTDSELQLQMPANLECRFLALAFGCARSAAARLGLAIVSASERASQPASRNTYTHANKWPFVATSTRAAATRAPDPRRRPARQCAGFPSRRLRASERPAGKREQPGEQLARNRPTE